MTADITFEAINQAKSSIDEIYFQPDPRAYLQELKKLDYAKPGNAKPVFQKLIDRLQSERDHEVQVLDLGCSYGLNAALLKHDMTMEELYEHWGQKALMQASSHEVIEYDRRFFGNLEDRKNINIVGLDRAEPAVSFGTETGLLDEGIAADLESSPLSAPAGQDLAPVDLVISAGRLGAITEKSFERLLPAVTRGRPPWIANFAARTFPFEPIAKALNEWGYVTERLEGHLFEQRAFASPEERDQVIEALRRRGLDPDGRESEGQLLAEFYLSRPADETAARPIEQLLAA